MIASAVSARQRIGFALICVLAVAIVIAASLLTPATDQVRTNLTPTTVVARLQTSKTPLTPALIAALQAARAAPEALEPAQAAARLLIDEGRRLGDSRLVGAAVGVLRPFLALDDPQTLYLSATARQYQHDFPGALALLDRAIALDPRHINARLSRATILTVLGRLTEAAAACKEVSQLRPDVGFLCQSTALMLTDQRAVVATRLAQIVDQPGLLDPALRPWALGLLGEIAVLQGDDPAALAQFAAVIAADPGVIRERLLTADILLRQSQFEQVLDVLDPAPPVDGVLIRRILAQRGLNAPGAAAPMVAELARRVAQNLELALTSHAREDAMYFLLVADDPAQALDRATVNWALQHEVEDAQLLIDAANAAGQPAAAAPVFDWARAEHVVVPQFGTPPTGAGQ
jgi:tetratricopeptide (TPR) repeat protein